MSKKIVVTKNQLEELYKNMTLMEMCKHLNISYHTLWHRMKYFGIKRKPAGYRLKEQYNITLSKEQIIDEYITKKLSIEKVAQNFKISVSTLIRKMDQFGIKRRPKNIKILVNRNKLYSMYIVKRMRIIDICKELKIKQSVLYNNLDRYNIPRRVNR